MLSRRQLIDYQTVINIASQLTNRFNTAKGSCTTDSFKGLILIIHSSLSDHLWIFKTHSTCICLHVERESNIKSYYTTIYHYLILPIVWLCCISLSAGACVHIFS